VQRRACLQLLAAVLQQQQRQQQMRNQLLRLRQGL
jgi:hypothetical protein